MTSTKTEKGTTGFHQKIQTALLALSTATLIGVFSFLWELNSRFAKMEQRDETKADQIKNLGESVKRVEGSTGEIRDRVIRLEAISTSK